MSRAILGGMMIRGIISRALVAALMSGVVCQPVYAQFNAQDAFGLTTDILRLGIEVNRAKAANEQAAATARLEQQQAAEAKATFYRRVQAALKSLGYYTMTVDGDPGPGTNRAIAAYQAAFGLYGDMDDAALARLEWHAEQGWRSEDELSAATSAGFRDRDSFVRAKEAGFDTASQYEAARVAGFTDAASFAAFQKSGASDKAAFEAQLAEAEAVAALTDQCLAGGEWEDVLAICRRASEASPSDVAVALAFDRALSDAAAGLEANEQQLTNKKAELASLVDGKGSTDQNALNALRAEINAMVETNLLAGLHLQARECNELVAGQDWDPAFPACYADVDTGALSGDARDQAEHLVAELENGRQAAEKGQAAERARIAAEAERLALEKALIEAEALLEQVQAYAVGGGTFEQGVAVARALVALRSAVAGDDATRITADHAVLLDLVEADAGFIDARAAMAEAQTRASQSALLAARQEAEVMDAFIVAYISANVTSDKVADLLSVGENLSHALASDNGEAIVAAQAAAREQLEALQLTRELSAFEAAYQAPQVSAEEVEMAAVAAANAEAEAANAAQALAAAGAQASALLDDVDAFARSGVALEDPISVARAIARLKAELVNPQLGQLTALTADLSDLLEKDAAFIAARSERQARQGSAMANAIALAREDLVSLNEFLLSHIAANLTADAIIEIVDLQVAVETALSEADSAGTVQARDRAIDGLVALGLDAQAKSFAEARRSSSVAADAETAQNGLSVTPANAALLDGKAGDLLVLRRSDGRAPHLTFNLLGQLAVDGGTASACWAHAAPANALPLLMARRDLRSMGVPDLELVECGGGEVDLILLRRGEFISSAPSQALPFVSAYEQGQLEILLTIDGQKADEEMAAIAETTQMLAMSVDNGTASGFGLITLPGSSGDICPVVDRFETHISALVARGDAIEFAISEPRLGTPMDSETAFAAAQRGQCAGIYADAPTLKTFVAALKRIGVDYAMTPIWVDTAEVEEETARLAAIEAEQIELAAQRAQQAEAASAILEAQTADQRSELEKRQAALRAEYQERSDAGHKDIADMVRAMVGSGLSVPLQQWFPETHDHLSRLLHDRWALTDLSTELSDYGTANWQGRSVDSVLVQVDIKRENALAGIYGDDCFVLGWLIDTEFRVNRDAFEAPCSDVQGLQSWRSARGFESVWNLSAN